ncbi:MAG: phosphoenolpyruvate---glycerone phosphotransferase subunit DhaM [Thermoleophilaceae bacterium]|nr:phosphoenolpyruvate---glycerone phosphotransferase subunit DhaM [Thermoleophilaceae bacterium]
MVGLVLVSHSEDIARGLAELASQMAGPEVSIETAGGLPGGGLGTDDDRVRDAIRHADRGEGVVVIGDLGSALLTVRHVLERNGNGRVVLADAPLVEGAVAAAVIASTGANVDEVALAAEEARGANKL